MVLLNVKGETFVIFNNFMRFGGIWSMNKTYKSGSIIMFSVISLAQIVIIITRLIDPLGKCLPYKPERNEIYITVRRIIMIIQYFILRACRERMVPLIESTINDWSSITDPKEREIMKCHDKSGSLYFYGRTSFFFVFYIIANIMALPNVEAPINQDYRMTCAFSEDSLWIYVILVLNIVVTSVTYVTEITGEILFWSLAMHLSAQFKILKSRCQNFLLIKNKEESRIEFRQLIDRHNKLCNLSGRLDRSFAVFTAIQVTFYHMETCLLAFHLGDRIVHGEFILTIYTLFFLSFEISFVFVYYYCGDYLAECSQEIGLVFTQCEWYTLSKESIINFSIVIARCQKSRNLSILKLYELNLYNFKYVIQSIYSYVSCIIVFMSRTKPL